MNECCRGLSTVFVLIWQVLAAVSVIGSRRFVKGMIRRKTKTRNHIGFLLSLVASLDAQSVDSRLSCEVCLCRAESVYNVSCVWMLDLS